MTDEENVDPRMSAMQDHIDMLESTVERLQNELLIAEQKAKSTDNSQILADIRALMATAQQCQRANHPDAARHLQRLSDKLNELGS